MTCYFPVTGYRSKDLTKNGKRKLTFSPQTGYVDLPVTVPCGNCIGCRIERSRQWAVRCVHEAQFHEEKCFLTLTYSDEKLPPGGTLVKKHFQDFMKRLRKRSGGKIKFFHCGEYGDTTNRPHYHALIYGLNFADRKFYKTTPQGHKTYTSELLDTIWGHGQCQIGELTFDSAAYTARYIMKKVTGEKAQAHYMSLIPETGEVIQREPEYITMSKGIGQTFYETYTSDLYPEDFVVHGGKKLGVPKYYDKRLAVANPKALEKIKRKRIRKAATRAADNTPERLAVRRTVKESKLKTLSRNSI